VWWERCGFWYSMGVTIGLISSNSLRCQCLTHGKVVRATQVLTLARVAAVQVAPWLEEGRFNDAVRMFSAHSFYCGLVLSLENRPCREVVGSYTPYSVLRTYSGKGSE